MTTGDQAAYTTAIPMHLVRQSVTVTKKWDDENDKDGIRRKSIQSSTLCNDQVGQEI